MWICSQIGAREHYAVPRALQHSSRLAAFYTDFWAAQTTRAVVGGGKLEALRSLAARYHPELIEATVASWNFRALGWEWLLRRRAKEGKQYIGYVEVGQRFAVRVREALKRRPDLGPDSIFFAYDTGALEAMEWCREKGISCILNQMDPNRVEVELVREEEKCWPGWAIHSAVVPEAYFRRREQEWTLADRVVVNSEFCRQALVKQGVPPEKLVVMSLAFEPEAGDRRWKMEDREQEMEDEKSANSETLTPNFQLPTSSTLRVLFLGQVILRKGIQYLIEAAQTLKGENIRFEIVGPIGISRNAIASAPGSMTFHGRAGRDQTANWYRQADVFVLPTLSDGFAITQLEAMAHGLPVVTTPCCGDVVSDGVDGFMVPAREADSLAKILLRYLKEAGLLKSQRQAALAKAKQFTSDQLAENLLRLEVDLKRGINFYPPPAS